MRGIKLDFQGSQTNINLRITLSNILEDSTLLDIYETKANNEVLIPISFLFSSSGASTTTPENSCPGIVGKWYVPFTKILGTSEPQIPQAFTLNKTSPELTFGIG